MSLVRARKNFSARSPARSVRAATICGRSNSSVMARPSAMRSGQNATSRFNPLPASIRSVSAVTPGCTVLRRIISWPWRRYSTQRSIAFGTAPRSGLRCSSTGVPTITTIVSALRTLAGSVVARRRPSRTAAVIGSWAPSSANGSSPRLTVSTAVALMSYSVTVSPRDASAIPRGSPTRPQPPMITASTGVPSWSILVTATLQNDTVCEGRTRLPRVVSGQIRGADRVVDKGLRPM